MTIIKMTKIQGVKEKIITNFKLTIGHSFLELSTPLPEQSNMYCCAQVASSYCRHSWVTFLDF